MDWGSPITKDVLLVLVTLALFIACIYYNRLVETLNGKGDDMHYVAFEVIGGVAGVLIASAVVFGVEIALSYFLMFAGAGLPMTWGYVRRHYLQAKHDREMIHQTVEGKLGNGD